LLLADGTYTGPENRDILVFNKRVSFISESGDPEACVVDCEGAGEDCITYSGWDMGTPPYPPASGTVEGIKITGAKAAVVAAVEASAWVRDCIISGSTEEGLQAIGVPGQGYGYVNANGCIFKSNPAGAMYSDFRCTASATECIFYSNGGVLDVDEEGYGWLTRCTLAANSGSAGGVISAGWYAHVGITNSIIAFNTGNALSCDLGSAEVECSDIYGNGGDYVGCIAGQNGVDGNISADPKFCSLSGRNFRLQLTSPCVPGNHPDGVDCGLIGALPGDCSVPGTEPVTWGAIKALYR
jgi:hypothetical protein